MSAIPATRELSTPLPRIRFDRNELAGAFGDIGTDLPLLIGMIAAARLDAASVLILFGAMQILTALRYGMPMPVQPLKAMAVLVIAQRLPATVLYGGGLAIGILMLLLSLTGALEALARFVPRPVVRGLQLGLGIQLALLAAKQYVPTDGAGGYVLAAIAFVLVLALRGNRRFPAALLVIALGVAYALVFRNGGSALVHGMGFALPAPRTLSIHDVWLGFVVLALPQIPLSLGNAILATRQVAEDLFPEKHVTVGRLGFTYAIMNLVNPWLGGVPTCHGSGGMVGHYTFGARTGGSIILYGLIFLILGFFFSPGFAQVIGIFPMPILGVLLFFEGLAMMALVRDSAADPADFFVVLLVGLLANGLPNGFLIGLVAGTAAYYARIKLAQARRPR